MGMKENLKVERRRAQSKHSASTSATTTTTTARFPSKKNCILPLPESSHVFKRVRVVWRRDNMRVCYFFFCAWGSRALKKVGKIVQDLL